MIQKQSPSLKLTNFEVTNFPNIKESAQSTFFTLLLAYNF